MTHKKMYKYPENNI